jgi:hypothetical protein
MREIDRERERERERRFMIPLFVSPIKTDKYSSSACRSSVIVDPPARATIYA